MGGGRICHCPLRKEVLVIPLLITAVHLSCLSMIETGQDDFAVSSTGCVSRYQIEPKIWFDKAGTDNPHDPKMAFIVAKKIWQARVVRFEKTQGRKPTLEELACLWHCPKAVLHMNSEQKDYAARFCNLIEAHAAAQAIQAKETHPR